MVYEEQHCILYNTVRYLVFIMNLQQLRGQPAKAITRGENPLVWNQLNGLLFLDQSRLARFWIVFWILYTPW